MLGLMFASASDKAIKKGEKYQTRGQNNLAITFYVGAQLAAINEKNNKNLANSAIKLAQVYISEKEYEKAEKECEDALSIIQEHALALSDNDRTTLYSTYASALLKLGATYYFGKNSFPQDYFIAAKYFQKSRQAGYSKARRFLKMLQTHSDITSAQLFSIAAMYEKGTEGVNIDELEFYRWKLLADRKKWRELEQTDCVAAAKHYIEKIQNTYKYNQQTSLEALQGLNRIFEQDDITGEQLNAIGLMYYTGTEGVREDHKQSKRWFEEAVKKKCAEAHRYLSLLRREEPGAAGNDLENIVENIFKEYEENRKEIPRKFPMEARRKKEYKKAHKELAIKLWGIYKNNDKLTSQVDADRNTELHHAARNSRLKDCARLVIMNPNSKNEKNSAGHLPFTSLNEEQKEKISSLQNVINELLSSLRTEAPKIIAEGLKKSSRGIWNDETETKIMETLRIINKNDKLSPLLELTKLAILGFHDLSKREKFTNDDYDSDDDDDEKMQRSQRLTIVLDGQGDSVNGTAHWGAHGQEGCDAVGVYFKGKNSLYIAGKRDPKDRQGTFIHEITHFVADEIFVNDCNPYQFNSDEERSFTKIAKGLNAKKSALPSVLQGAFSSSYQSNDHIHSELIVRVAQMIARGEEEEVRNKAKELYDYYCDKFLPRVKEHCARLETRILSGWPKEMLAPAPNVRVALSID